MDWTLVFHSESAEFLLLAHQEMPWKFKNEFNAKKKELMFDWDGELSRFVLTFSVTFSGNLNF